MIKPRQAVQNMKKYDPPLGRRKGKLRLDFNENTVGCSPQVIDALRKVDVEDVAVYPDYAKFKKKLARYLNVGENSVLLTNGTDEAIKAVMDAYVDKGDEVVIPTPTFAMFNVYAQVAEARIVEVLYNQDLSFPVEQVLDKMSERTKLVVLVSPNNPTGTSIGQEDVARIVEKGKNSVVLIDEAYCQYCKKSFKDLIKRYDNVIILQTFSKAFGLAGLRLGCAISNPELIEVLQKVISPYSVNSLALVAGSAALQDTEFVEDYVAEVQGSKRYIEKELAMLGIQTCPSEANFVIANFGDGCNRVYEKLKEKDILVRDRSNYPLLRGCLRIGIGARQQSFMLIHELKRILRRKVILFDLDGVLVDVSQSYRQAIQKTAEFFTRQTITVAEIQECKERGGYNNDWHLTEALILLKGVNAKKENVVQKFQEFYACVVDSERWLLPKELLSELYRQYRLGIVTGRPKEETYYVMERFGMLEFFDSVVTMDDYPDGRAKPDPFSINLALKQLECRRAVYFGDGIDDMKAAGNARIKAVGVLPPGVQSEKLELLLKENGAIAVLKNVSDVKDVLK